MLTSVQNVCVVTTFYTLESMKSILLPKFVFFRSRLRLSLKNTNLLFYWFICFLWGVALRIITYPAPSRREAYVRAVPLLIVGSGFCPIVRGHPRAMLAPDAGIGQAENITLIDIFSLKMRY